MRGPQMSLPDASSEYTAWNILNRPTKFRLGEVKSILMLDTSGQVIGICFPSKQGDGRTADWWSRNTSNRPVVSFNSLAPDGTHAAPWGSDYSRQGPMFIFAHAGPERFRLSTEEGRTLKVDGATFAEICLSNTHLQEALQARPNSSVVLLACESGAKQDPGGGGRDFSRVLHGRGLNRNVYAPTETINLVPAFAAINVDKGGTFDLVSDRESPDRGYRATLQKYATAGVAEYAAMSPFGTIWSSARCSSSSPSGPAPAPPVTATYPRRYQPDQALLVPGIGRRAAPPR